MNKLFVVILISVSCSFGWASEFTDAMDKALDGLKGKVSISGTISVKKNGEVYVRGFGLADQSKSQPNSADSIFLIASNTKQFIGAAILQLEEAGSLKTSDPLTKYFPEYPAKNLKGANGKTVTIEHLAKHESGLPEAYNTPEIAKKVFKETISFSEILNSIKDKKLVFSPGTKHVYSNTGYIFLGEVIRRVTKMSVTEFLGKNPDGLFTLAKLKSTSVGLPLLQINLAQCYEMTSKGLQNYVELYEIKDLGVDDTFTDGNIYSTAPDLLIWMEALLKGQVLKPETLKKLFHPSVLGKYGYGWSINKTKNGGVSYSHSGLWLAYESFIAAFPQEDIYVAYLGNQVLDEKSNSLLMATIMKAVFEP